jgi:hypothetical protein
VDGLDAIQLVLGKVKTMTGKELTEYFITDSPESSTIEHQDNDMKEVMLKIIFKRRLTNEAMNTFFPSMLLVVISYFTAFFKKPNFFNTAITVNLTVMLTITTLLISVRNKLSTTSYIKWIEYWLIFAQLTPFTQVMLISCIEWFMQVRSKRRDELKKMKETMLAWKSVGNNPNKVCFYSIVNLVWSRWFLA